MEVSTNLSLLGFHPHVLTVCQPVGSFYVLYDEAYETEMAQRGEAAQRSSGDDDRPTSYAGRLKRGNGGRIHQQYQASAGR